MSTPDEGPSELDSVRERLNVVTQETRFSLVQDSLGHPSGLPTLKELDYVDPGESRTTILQHLQRLVDVGIVEEVSLPEDRRRNDLPYECYGLSELGRRFLEEHELLGPRPRFERSTLASRKLSRSSGTRVLPGPNGDGTRDRARLFR